MSKYMKNFNGEKVFSLEYDKETLRDLVLEYQKEIERLNNIIKEAKRYIEDKYAVILADDLFLDHDERIERKRLLELLEILDKGE